MTPRDFTFWVLGYLEAIEPPEGLENVKEPGFSYLTAIRRACDVVVSDIEDGPEAGEP